jgi:aquaporin Z
VLSIARGRGRYTFRGATDKRAPKALAPLAIGLTLTLIHLISIPVDNTSVNPARSLAPALFVGGWALSQIWVFIVFPLLGGALAGLLYRYLFEIGELPADMPTAGAPRESEIEGGPTGKRCQGDPSTARCQGDPSGVRRPRDAV